MHRLALMLSKYCLQFRDMSPRSPLVPVRFLNNVLMYEVFFTTLSNCRFFHVQQILWDIQAAKVKTAVINFTEETELNF